MNFALAHCMGATIQTALFNSSLVVIVGWGLHKGMDLNFEVFNIVVLIMAIIVVGNFLRDQASSSSSSLLPLRSLMLKLRFLNRNPITWRVHCAYLSTLSLVKSPPRVCSGFTYVRLMMNKTAIAAFYYPDPPEGSSNTAEAAGVAANETTAALIQLLKR